MPETILTTLSNIAWVVEPLTRFADSVSELWPTTVHNCHTVSRESVNYEILTAGEGQMEWEIDKL